MTKYVIHGGKPLHGEVEISGAKNAAVAILPAALLVDGVCRIENVPDISDVTMILGIMKDLGANVRTINPTTVELDCSKVYKQNVPYELARQIRASYYLIGALLGRFGRAEVPPPGGCDLGVRPIDQHLKGFSAMGAEIQVENGFIHAASPTGRLHGAQVYLDVVSVGATMNILIAAALADGLTQLYDSGTALVDGANALRDGLSAVSGAVGGMTSGDTGSNDEMMAQLDEQLAPVISNYGTTVVTDTVTDADLLAALTAAGLTGEQQQAVLGAVGVAMGKALQNDTPAMVQGVAGTVSGVLMSQLGSGICQLQTGLDQLASGSAELARGADTYVKAVGQVSQGADALAEGSAKLDDASDAMYEGLAELHDGAAELHDGVQEFSDKNTDNLSDDLGGDLRNVVRRLKAVQQAGKNYQTFSGLHNGDIGSVKFIVETAEIKK